jgi:hypothetical protein
MKRLRNTSGIPDEKVKEIVDWIAGTLGLTNFDVECRKSQHTFGGRAYLHGSSYHTTRRPFVVLRVGTETREHWEVKSDNRKWVAQRRSWLSAANQPVARKVSKNRFPCFLRPYQYRQHRGKRYVLANRLEVLVYLAAHELRHLWQAARLTDRRRSAPLPMAWGSKGKYSEVDTEAFAIHTLREWRRLSERLTPTVL